MVLVLGALLGTQNGRDVEIVNTFELAMEDDGLTVDQGFLIARKEQCELQEDIQFRHYPLTIIYAYRQASLPFSRIHRMVHGRGTTNFPPHRTT